MSTFSCFSTLVKLVKKSGCIQDYFHSLYEKSKNNIKPIKNQQHAKFFILLWDYSTSVTFGQKHIYKRVNHHSCQYSSFFSFDPKVFLLSISEKFVITPKVIVVLQVVLPISLLVSCFCSKDVVTYVSSSIALYP